MVLPMVLDLLYKPMMTFLDAFNRKTPSSLFARQKPQRNIHR